MSIYRLRIGQEGRIIQPRMVNDLGVREDGKPIRGR
jgi:hypothetical protein